MRLKVSEHTCLHEGDLAEIRTDIKYIRKSLDKIDTLYSERFVAIEKEVVLNSDDRKFRTKLTNAVSFAAGSGWAIALFSFIIGFM
jgi:hypothetical protein